MLLSPLENDRLCHFLNNSRCHQSLRGASLARLFRSSFSRANLNRLANSRQRFNVHQASVLINGLAPIVGLRPDRVWAALRTPNDPDLRPEYELATGHFRSIRPADVSELARDFRSVNAISGHWVALHRGIPWFLLDAEVSYPAMRSFMRSHNPDPRRSFRRLRQEVDSCRETFFLNAEFSPLRPSFLSVTLSDILGMFTLRPPFANCNRDAVIDSLESVAIDAVLGRGLLIAVINDALSGPARRWVAQHSWIASLIMAGDDLLVLRRANRQVWRVFRRGDDPAWPTLSGYYCRVLSQAGALACHPLTTEASARFLLELVARARGSGPGGTGIS